MKKNDKAALLGLYLEIKSLLPLINWQPIGSLVEKLYSNLSSTERAEVEGLSTQDIVRLRRWAKRVRNTPQDTFKFIGAVLSRDAIINGGEHRISAFNYLMWGIVENHELPSWTNQYLAAMWREVFGYECPYRF